MPFTDDPPVLIVHRASDIITKYIVRCIESIFRTVERSNVEPHLLLQEFQNSLEDSVIRDTVDIVSARDRAHNETVHIVSSSVHISWTPVVDTCYRDAFRFAYRNPELCYLDPRRHKKRRGGGDTFADRKKHQAPQDDDVQLYAAIRGIVKDHTRNIIDAEHESRTNEITNQNICNDDDDGLVDSVCSFEEPVVNSVTVGHLLPADEQPAQQKTNLPEDEQPDGVGEEDASKAAFRTDGGPEYDQPEGNVNDGLSLQIKRPSDEEHFTEVARPEEYVGLLDVIRPRDGAEERRVDDIGTEKEEEEEEKDDRSSLSGDKRSERIIGDSGSECMQEAGEHVKENEYDLTTRKPISGKDEKEAVESDPGDEGYDFFGDDEHNITDVHQQRPAIEPVLTDVQGAPAAPEQFKHVRVSSANYHATSTPSGDKPKKSGGGNIDRRRRTVDDDEAGLGGDGDDDYSFAMDYINGVSAEDSSEMIMNDSNRFKAYNISDIVNRNKQTGEKASDSPLYKTVSTRAPPHHHSRSTGLEDPPASSSRRSVMKVKKASAKSDTFF